MKNEIMCAAMASMMLSFGGFAFAQNQNPANAKTGNESTHPAPPQKMMELEELEGKVKVSGKGSSRIITLTTDSKDTHVLVVMSMEKPKGSRKELKPMDSPEKSQAEGIIDTQNANDNTILEEEKNVGKFKHPEGKGPKDRPKMVSMNDLCKLKGKKAKVKGIMNKETNIFTVFEIVE